MASPFLGAQSPGGATRVRRAHAYEAPDKKGKAPPHPSALPLLPLGPSGFTLPSRQGHKDFPVVIAKRRDLVYGGDGPLRRRPLSGEPHTNEETQ